MIGVFDSGVGGITVVNELRSLMPSADICFFADEKNAPYGTKSKEELIPLVERDIKLLSQRGADKIIMACCTASTVHGMIESRLQNLSFPIIEPTARAAAKATKNGRVGVIATEATVRSSAFKKALLKYASIHEVLEIQTQRLVKMVESGARDGKLNNEEKNELKAMLLPFANGRFDTLILGCTHFPHLEREIASALGGINIISSSREGAHEIAKEPFRRENGKTIYIRNGKERI